METSQHPWIDASRAPLYVMHFPSDPEILLAEGASYVTAFRRLWEGIDRRVAIVADLTAVLGAPQELRSAIAQVDRDMREKQKVFTAAWAVIIRKRVQRVIWRTYLWMAPPACPHRTFVDVEDGVEWCRQSLAAEGIQCGAEGADVGGVLRSAREIAEGVRDRSRAR